MNNLIFVWPPMTASQAIDYFQWLDGVIDHDVLLVDFIQTGLSIADQI